MKHLLLISCSLLLLTACQTENSHASNTEANSQPTSQSQSQERSLTNQNETTTSQAATESQDKPSQEESKVSDYYPLTANYQAHFQGEGNEFSSFDRVYDFIEDNYVQSRTDNSGTSVMEIVRVGEDRVDLITTQPEFYIRENYIPRFKDQAAEKTLLKAPLEVGTNWDNSDEHREITALDQDIKLANGDSVPSIEVTVTGEGMVSKEYYAKDYGLVYEETVMDGEDAPIASSRLETMTTDGWEETITVTQVNDQGDDYYEENVDVPIETNTRMRDEFQKLLSGANDLQALLPEGTKINALHTNNLDHSTVYVDFSPEIETIKGSTASQTSYHAIFKTLADYYHADQIVATVNNEPIEIDQVGPLPQPYIISQN
ncbi:GerMN domain-containing protein [Aerococcus kribbianus]|uniref:GerMN domain-containing protein n=1 Tax=Aerococcus kribbianus TaxID=2999064 RepID=A0A9X3FM89_9LACT|nr:MULTISPECIES: GerMN domain-containing protein [unclassified Aerococcus]MCZ0716829.1 GerMN domain-containing protein [Aerococcus sp. YH-aer221]MCZ0725117.1 GerMN domain-containing protein [Aerococcus sp. YH-aer222]